MTSVATHPRIGERIRIRIDNQTPDEVHKDSIDKTFKVVDISHMLDEEYPDSTKFGYTQIYSIDVILEEI